MAKLFGTCSIPSNCYSIYDIAKYEHIAKDKIEDMAKRTLKSTVDVLGNNNVTSLTTYFNDIGNKDNQINRFLEHWSIQPYARAIKVKFETSKSATSKSEITYYTFYVLKSVYHDWKNKKITYEPKQVKLSTFDTKSRANMTAIRIPTNYVVKHFKDIVKALKLNISDTIVSALNEYMQNHKDVFGEYGTQLDESLIQENKTTFACGNINKELNNKIWKFIQRYNQCNVDHIRYCDFLESALVEKYKSLPVKYTDPQLYADYIKELKQAKQLENEYKNGGE